MSAPSGERSAAHLGGSVRYEKPQNERQKNVHIELNKEVYFWRRHFSLQPLKSGHWEEGSTWRQKLEHVVEHKITHIIIALLLIIDLLLVIASIAIEIIKLEDALHSCEKAYDNCFKHSNIEKYLEGETHPPSKEFENHLYEQLDFAFFVCSLTILCIFLLENILLLIAIGFRRYFTNWFNVFDLVIVVVSIVLEIVFFGQPEAGLLIICRMWRFIRIGHAFYVETLAFYEDEKKMFDEMDKAVDHDEKHELKEMARGFDRGHGSQSTAERGETAEGWVRDNPRLALHVCQVLGRYYMEHDHNALHIGEHSHHSDSHKIDQSSSEPDSD